MNRNLSRYGNYPRKPQGIQKKPKITKGVIEEKTITLPGGNTLTIGNAPNVKRLKKKGYDI